MSSALSAAVLAMCARDSLADAARLIRDAQGARLAAGMARPGALLSPAQLRQRAASLLAEARAIIASARKLYARAMAQLAQAGKLSHHYAEAGGRYRAMLRIDGMTVAWLSPRTYGKRQSAQRAALAHVRKLATSGACAGVLA